MVAACGAVGAVFAVSAPVGAQPTPTPVVVAAEVETLCTPTETGIAELSGLTADGDRFFAVGDSGTDQTVWVLDHDCAVTGTLAVPVDSYDVEDLALHDGTLWLSDTGDNDRRRETIALTSMDPGSGAGGLHRLSYPDTAQDAEALLVGADGRPVIVTKTLLGQSGVYVSDIPVADLPSPGPSPLRRAGAIRVGPTDTPGGPVPTAGSTLVTGGAVSVDGRVVALRTYTDAYLFAAPDGDVVAALTESTPIRIPLPDEPQGEAIAFTDGGHLLTASESGGGSLPPIRIIRGATDLVPMPEDSADASVAVQIEPAAGVAVGVVLAVVAAGAVWWIVRRRRA
ncbi:membrane protein [Rhodococcus triatomae BKS 15-14]|nr:membrane protein [Rhodococcus triatomae BKS 15-14]